MRIPSRRPHFSFFAPTGHPHTSPGCNPGNSGKPCPRSEGSPHIVTMLHIHLRAMWRSFRTHEFRAPRALGAPRAGIHGFVGADWSSAIFHKWPIGPKRHPKVLRHRWGDWPNSSLDVVQSPGSLAHKTRSEPERGRIRLFQADKCTRRTGFQPRDHEGRMDGTRTERPIGSVTPGREARTRRLA